MGQRGVDLSFADEPPRRFAARSPEVQGLDGDPLGELVVRPDGLVHGSHAALSHFAGDPIGTQRTPQQRSRRQADHLFQLFVQWSVEDVAGGFVRHQQSQHETAEVRIVGSFPVQECGPVPDWELDGRLPERAGPGEAFRRDGVGVHQGKISPFGT